MFSVLFPGQGSQIVGMAREFYENFAYVKEYFAQADEILKKKISKIILEGPKDQLDQTTNTQPSIFLVSYSIFNVIKNETNFNLNNAKFFAGHSLGEYSALCCADSLNFEQTIDLLKHRGNAMQNAVPNGEGGMLAVLGINIDEINNIFKKFDNKLYCYVANDNSNGQIVISGKKDSLLLLSNELKNNKYKYVSLPVSSPFHCPLMNKATEEMSNKINNTQFKDPIVNIVSNVTANPTSNSKEIKKLLIDQIEKPVRWRESVINMINKDVKRFVEIGPGKVLSGLVKRINRNVKLFQVNTIDDIKFLKND
jgi:[acyl-carrier-protein] S-malonyltransferase